MAKTNLNRRTFLRVSALASGGFMLGLYPKAAALAQGGRPAAPALLPADFISIASSGIVSITSRNPETGQHSLNMLAMLMKSAGSNAGAAVRPPCANSAGVVWGYKPSKNPPPSSAEPRRKVRRLRFVFAMNPTYLPFTS